MARVISTFEHLIDLASERFGAAVVAANDDFFASKENLIKPGPSRWIEGKYTDRGKWMDGWETRRRRDQETYDWCVIRLGTRGLVRGVDVDTTHFTGNFPEACAIDVTSGFNQATEWHEVLPRTPLRGDAHNWFAIDRAPAATHVRLRIFPDGGVARLRVHGTVVADWPRLKRRGEVDLGAAEHGGIVLSTSDMFFGSGHNLIMPGDATHMGDGWETRRRRGPGHDWAILRLAAAGAIHRIEVDTRHFKGNAPGACSLEYAVEPSVAGAASPDSETAADAFAWRELMPRTCLDPHRLHTFEVAPSSDAATHVRFNIFPDGGIGRLRLWGLAR